MLDLTRFPVSDEFISDRKTFCTILDRKVFFDHRTHGIVGNSMADRMRSLPGPCGGSLGSEGPPKGQKYAFVTRNHLF